MLLPTLPSPRTRGGVFKVARNEPDLLGSAPASDDAPRPRLAGKKEILPKADRDRQFEQAK
ncbi:hypothetical protein N657DRAFT_646456, partial [Parathielavia appendiculata]